MQNFNEYKANQRVAPFFGKLMQIRQQAHVLHLASHSFAEHKALGEFYETLNNLNDKLIEVYQGQYGLIEITPEESKPSSAENFLQRAGADFLEAHSIFEEKDSHLHNILDEIIALTYHTLYKVRFLK